MFKKSAALLAFVCCIGILNAQNVFDPNGTLVTYNGAALAGGLTNPNLPPYYVMSKWTRTPVLSRNTYIFKIT